MVFDSKVAKRFAEPVLMNQKGERVDKEEESYGCKVSIDLQRPDMCIVLDEVGSNLSMENDNANGGQLFVCGPEEEAYQSVATKGNHFTCLGLTRLDREALMCVVIIQGKRRDILTEAGVDWTKLYNSRLLDNCTDDEIEQFS